MTIGVDIGTSSSKGVLVDNVGHVMAESVRAHVVDRPYPGWVEMSAAQWWDECVDIIRDLIAKVPDAVVTAVGASGMGPCLLVTDENSQPLRNAMLYGIDTRATAQIEQLSKEFGEEQILQRCGSVLSTQAVGPKLAWLSENEPEVWARARRMFMPGSWLVYQLTGKYILDQQSASQCTPLYDADAQNWYEPWSKEIAPDLDFPPLMWPGEIAGRVTPTAASLTGLEVGTPVVAGTIDAWAEALSGDAHRIGDLMLMYGSTMFLVNTLDARVSAPMLWGTTGAMPGTYSLAAGMATSGAITDWLREIVGGPDIEMLLQEASDSGPGARGLLMLPYFAGERTPIADPLARGLIAGLTLSHHRGDLYRAALEATAFGVRHNVESIRNAGGRIERVIAIGGGTKGGLWTQIVSDVTGLTQFVPSQTIGASLGMAFLAACSVGEASITEWNPIGEVKTPREETFLVYEDRYRLYRQLYTATADITHELAGNDV